MLKEGKVREIVDCNFSEGQLHCGVESLGEAQIVLFTVPPTLHRLGFSALGASPVLLGAAFVAMNAGPPGNFDARTASGLLFVVTCYIVAVVKVAMSKKHGVSWYLGSAPMAAAAVYAGINFLNAYSSIP